MAQVTAQLVKELREMTGAGMMDCKKALVEAAGDMEQAVVLLREKGLSKAEKKSGRIAAEGLVRLCFDADHRKAAMVEVNSETDFVAKNPEFIDFVEKLAARALSQKTNDMDAFLETTYEGDKKIKEALTDKVAKIGENLKIRRIQSFATPGVVYVGYLHGGGRIGVIIGLETEGSYEEVLTTGKDVAMQVASMNPEFLDESQVSTAWLEKETEIARQQLLNEGKKAELIDRIIPGKIKALYKEVCLVDQKFVKNADMTVKAYVDSQAKELGKPIRIAEMARFEVGEGLEKKSEDFAAEVAATVGQK